MRDTQKIDTIKLFLISFLILFFELICIRWIPAYVRYMGYFSNVILLASFLGIGTGCLLADKKSDLLNFFPLVLYGSVLLILCFKFEARITSPLMVYFTEYWRQAPTRKVESFFLLPLIFTVVAVLFLFLSQKLGKLLKTLPPLKAYTINILGALTGIAAFSFLSFLSTKPFIWFFIFAVTLLLLLNKKGVFFIINLTALILTLLLVFGMGIDTFWSPYYKITFEPFPRVKNAYIINVNNIGHQDLIDIKLKEFFYHFPYNLSTAPFENVLILGAGCGNDTAAALLHHAKKIDAVEIDPFISGLGKTMHPNFPYRNKNVSLYVDDGRAFLKKSKSQYDLIIYGLIDSLTLTSGFSNVRLENYLFTLESFRDAKSHLKKGGIFVIYNYFREEWLVDKLANMLKEVFGRKPYVYIFPKSTNLALLVASEGISDLLFQLPANKGNIEFIEPSTDDWPFIYLKMKSIPMIYIKALVIILLLSFFFVFFSLGKGKAVNLHFFFLGAGFMLLETESIIKFALLFGSTWLVNSLVIAAILLVTLAATLTVSRIKRLLFIPAYALLFIFLLLNYLVSYAAFFSGNYVVRYLVVSLLAFSPLFAAGIIFATSLKQEKNSIAIAFGSNLLGAMIGGAAEYLSLVLGYHSLQFVIIGFYLLSLFYRNPQGKG
jgi:hypothetical protein